MKILNFLILFLGVSGILNAQSEQIPIAGKIDRIRLFPSTYVDARNIDIWLPPQYDGKKKFAVLYMHDGQMLFDTTDTWNHQSWEVDDVAHRLMQDKLVKNFIVVGIWNNGQKRRAEYFPQKVYSMLESAEKDTAMYYHRQWSPQDTGEFKPLSDDYLKFVVKELKPLIDKQYAVLTDAKNTFMAGSSMGGLISMYAICEYPEVFGGVACLSTHWTGSVAHDNNPIPGAFLRYLQLKLPKPDNHKIYFDCGDKGIDAHYPAVQSQVDKLMMKKGFGPQSWDTQYFRGQGHSEQAWNGRLDIPLFFLLGK